jgi:hypothetical protein
MDDHLLALWDEKFLKRTIYPHGGSRIWLEDASGHRELLADTYEPKEISDIVFEAIKEAIRERGYNGS